MPRRTVRTDDCSFYVPDGLLRLEGKKRSYFRRYGSESDRFRRVERDHARCVRQWALKVENRLLSPYTPKKLYAFVKSKKQTQSTVPDLVHAGVKCTTDAEKCEAFSSFFSSVYTEDDGSLPNFPPRTTQHLQNISINTYHVLNAIHALKAKFSTGPDKIPSILIKKIPKAFAFPLSQIFDASLRQGVLPPIWKSSSVTPIPKKGDPKDVNNYRPISKQSTILKIFEKVIVKQLLAYLEANNLLAPEQFGFRPGRSVTTQLLTCLDNWTKNFDVGTHVALLDFKKAFDSVSHRKLLHKLTSYGITGNLHSWISSYLSGRSQCVEIGTSSSKSCPITSGILQGSVLGPLLFLLYINDLPEQLTNVNISLFADDSKAYSTSPVQLQQALCTIKAWCDSWQLTLSPTKCVTIFISKAPLETPVPLYIDGHILEESSVQRDLGVLVTSNLSFSQHIQAIVKKANRVCFFIMKMFTAGRPLIMAKAFAIYARPHLESFSPVWNPCRRNDNLTQEIKLLESVQRDFTRAIYFKCSLPPADYHDRLKFLQLPTIEHRRKVLDLSLAHSLNRQPNMAGSHLLPHKPHQRQLRQLSTLRNEPRARGPRKNFFSNRIVSEWNAIPDEAKILSKNAFKTKIPI